MEQHNIEIEPPDQVFKHFRVNCSYGDLKDRPAATRIEAKEIAYGHASEIFKIAWEQEQQISRVDDTDDMLHTFFDQFLDFPLDVEGKEW